MATTTRNNRTRRGHTKNRRVSLVDSLSLPTEPSKPSVNFGDFWSLIYGMTKIGKTTLTSKFEKTIHFMFEPGSKALKIFAVAIPDWNHFLAYITLLERDYNAGKLRFKNCVIDTGDIAYDRCQEHICRLRGVSHPNEANDYGATWKEVSSEFERAHMRLTNIGLGIIIIAHEQTIEVEKHNGETFNQIVPEFSKQARTYYTGLVDNTFHYTYDGTERFLEIRGNDFIIAGTRCEENFNTPDGEKVWRIPMGNSSDEAYRNLIKAFNNRQEETLKPLKGGNNVKKKRSRNNVNERTGRTGTRRRTTRKRSR